MLCSTVRLYGTESEVQSRLRVMLAGKVFHVTNRPGFGGIVQSGAIKSNESGWFAFSTGSSSKSYWPRREHISVFDFRHADSSTMGEVTELFPWWLPRELGDVRVHFVLHEVGYEKLMLAPLGIERFGLCIPHVEVGFPERVPLELITTIIWAKITEETRKIVQIRAMAELIIEAWRAGRSRQSHR